MQGGDIGGNPILIGDLGPIGDNGEDVRGDAPRISEKNNGEAVAAKGRRDMGYSQGGISLGSGGNPVGNDLHQKTSGDGGTVCGTEANIRGMHKGDGI